MTHAAVQNVHCIAWRVRGWVGGARARAARVQYEHWPLGRWGGCARRRLCAGGYPSLFPAPLQAGLQNSPHFTI